MTDILNRLNLQDGQFFGQYKFKNLQWVLNNKQIGFGDLTLADINNIQKGLLPGEVFFGFNEHHGTLDGPMITITEFDAFTFRGEFV